MPTLRKPQFRRRSADGHSAWGNVRPAENRTRPAGTMTMAYDFLHPPHPLEEGRGAGYKKPGLRTRKV